MSIYAKRNESAPFSVSQNFLTSRTTIQRLLRLTSICASDHVIEIGAGKGHITRELAKACRRVSAYEIDAALCKRLHEALRDTANVEVQCRDFLKAPLPGSDAYKVFSNIPFSITSDIVRKLTSSQNPPREAWLVMEKGAAKRFIGKPYDSRASILIKPYFDARIEYYFSRQDFHPLPSVDIVLLHLTKKTAPDLPMSQQKSFADFVDRCIRHGIYGQLTKRQTATALKSAGLTNIQTPGTILYVQWLCLFRCYSKFYGG